MAHQVLNSETVYRGRAITVRRDLVRFPNGAEVPIDVAEHNGAVVMLPLDAEERVLFVRQYRHAIGQDLLELPAGTLEPGEEPAACAQRELREEVGMGADSLEHLADFYAAPGYSTELMHLFLARGLFPDALPGDEDEDLTIEAIPLDRALRMAVAGEYRDAKTLIGLLLAADALNKMS